MSININDNKIEFGNYKSAEKIKDTIDFNGNIYKIKTYKEVTRLEKNDNMVYESVPGTTVKNYINSDTELSFTVFGYKETSIILDIKENIEVFINGEKLDNPSFMTENKLNIILPLNEEEGIEVKINKYGK